MHGKSGAGTRLNRGADCSTARQHPTLDVLLGSGALTHSVIQCQISHPP
jgi:hypothetical protein